MSPIQTNAMTTPNHVIKSCVIAVISIFLSLAASAQEQITKDDYERAVGFLWQNIANKKVFREHVTTNWFPDSTGFWYTYYSAEGRDYRKVTVPDLDQSQLFDHDRLAEALAEELGDEEVDPKKLPISRLTYKGPTELAFNAKNKRYELDLTDYSLTEPERGEDGGDFEEASPDKQWIAYPHEYNLYVRSADSTMIKQLSTDGERGYEYATWYGWADIIEGENGERPQRFWADWSPDNQWIRGNLVDFRIAQKMYLLDWSVDTLYRPRLLSYYRGSPGDSTVIYENPVFFNIETGKSVRPDLPLATHFTGYNVKWSSNPGIVYLRGSSRGYQNMYVHKLNLETEELETIYSESSETNIDAFDWRWLEDLGHAVFLSERSGWRQLYRFDLETREVVSLTQGEYYVNSIRKIDETERKVYFSASGKDPNLNPYFQQLYSVSLDGGDTQLLTPEDRFHNVSISPDAKYVVDNYSTVEIPTKTVLRSTENGEALLEISEASIEGIDNWSLPEVFTATARDGKTTIYGALWKPTNFDPNKKYPVIESVYTGPHTQVFPKEFRNALYGLQSYAELGFVVISVDGLGSARRSKAFHDYSYKNLGGNLEDHVLAIKELGKKYSWIDTTRVGIFGHSAGGYDAAHALLAYPETYHVAVASSADHDHRMEKAWWPEMYMGWPVDSAYHQQSNITMAGNLKGKLLITHGGIDENVNPSATFKLAEALIKADKQFDMLILPSQRHGYRGGHDRYFRKVRWNYFVEHLRGVEPIWDFEW